VAYSPQRRECRLSGYDQRDSRILYDPVFDYYENLVVNSVAAGECSSIFREPFCSLSILQLIKLLYFYSLN
jgi:hypothetical protein